MPQLHPERGLDEPSPKQRKRLDDWPRLTALHRVVLVLLWYGAICFLGLMMVGILLVFTGSIGIKIGRAWGGSWFARVGGYSIAFVLMLGAQVAAGLILGWLFAS